ncbi:hypothetical protein RA27_08715 [Ruegeria sp. ANG-R]|nr:hypothetical protein RA27_08715 [Ruegeria sp. ANG-R]
MIGLGHGPFKERTALAKQNKKVPPTRGGERRPGIRPVDEFSRERAKPRGANASATADQQNGGQRRPEGRRKRAARFAGGKPTV